MTSPQDFPKSLIHSWNAVVELVLQLLEMLVETVLICVTFPVVVQIGKLIMFVWSLLWQTFVLIFYLVYSTCGSVSTFVLHEAETSCAALVRCASNCTKCYPSWRLYRIVVGSSSRQSLNATGPDSRLAPPRLPCFIAIPYRRQHPLSGTSKKGTSGVATNLIRSLIFSCGCGSLAQEPSQSLLPAVTLLTYGSSYDTLYCLSTTATRLLRQSHALRRPCGRAFGFENRPQKLRKNASGTQAPVC